MAKRTKKLSRPTLKLEALEQRQLLAGITGGGTEVGTDIHHPNGNVYDQVLLTGTSVKVTNDANQVTRVSFLDLNGDIVQAEFSGKGTLTVALDSDTSKADQAPAAYNQTGVKYMQGLASFTIEGSDASTNFQVFSVGKGNAVNASLFDATHTGGDHFADVQRITVVADTANPNGSTMGSIRAGDALFSASSGVVGITAANVQVQNLVRIYDIDAKGTATPALTFGEQSQFGSVEVLGGDLVQSNGRAINNSGSYAYQISSGANVDSAGNDITAKVITAATAPFSDKSPYPAAKSYNLTTAIDNLVASTGDDIINASQQTGNGVVSALDKVDGGAGNDLLSINDATHDAQISGLTVTNVETLAYTSTEGLGVAKNAANPSLNVTGWTGLTTASITLQDIGTSATKLTAGKDTAVTITSNSSGASGAWTVIGGKTVTLTQTSTTSAAGASVTGVEGTTTVSVTQSTDGAKGPVDVTDWANDISGSGNQSKTGTITSVTLNGVSGDSGDGSVAATVSTVSSNALTTLSLTGVKGTDDTHKHIVELADNLAAHKSGAGTTVAVNLNQVTDVTLKDVNATVKEIDFTTSGKGSSVNPTGAGELTTIKVAGDQSLNLGDVTGLGKLVTLTGTGTAGVSATVAAGVTVTAGDGNDAIIISAATKKAISLGGGDDQVTVPLKNNETLDGGSIDGGAGTDTLVLTGTDAKTASLGTTLADSITGFEKIKIITNGAAGSINLHNLDDINQVELAVDQGGYTLDKVASGAKLTISADQSVAGTVTIPVAAIQNETLGVTITANDDGIAANLIHTGSINAVNLTVADTKSGGVGTNSDHSVEFDQVKNITVGGKVHQLTLTSNGATNVDATGMTGGKLVLVSTAGEGATLKGTTTGINDINATGAAKTLTIITGGKSDTIGVGSNGSTITSGDGGDSITVAGGSNTITTGKDGDTIKLNGTSGTNTVNVGDGNDKVYVTGAAQNTITLGGGTDTVFFGNVPGTAGYYTTISGAGAGDKIDLSAVNTRGDADATTLDQTAVQFADATHKIVLGAGVSFTDYLNKATDANTPDGTHPSVVTWFQFGGDTYVVMDNSTSVDFDPTKDMVFKIAGTSVDMTKAVMTDGVITLG